MNLPVGRATIFTIGAGNELCCQCVKLLEPIIQGENLALIYGDFRQTWRNLTNHH